MNLLTVAEVCQRLGIAPSTWRAYVARGQAPQPDRRIGREPLWSPRTIERWQASRPRVPR